MDSIYLEEEESDLEEPSTAPDPIVIRGNGTVTIFGLNNRFDTKFPKRLNTRVAPEEFQETMKRINTILTKTVFLNAKWLFCGCFCCCCTFGVSLWPVLCLNKRAKDNINKLLSFENYCFYNRLGLHWRLNRQHGESSSLLEYVILIDFLPKLNIYTPD